MTTNLQSYYGSHQVMSFLLDGVNATYNDQENALFVSAYVSSAATTSYQKNAIMGWIETADQSNGLGGVAKDAVAVSGFGNIAASNPEGRAWGGNFVCTVPSTSNGQCTAVEFDVDNDGPFQPVTATGENAKLGISIVSKGTNSASAAIAVGSIGGAGFGKVLYSPQVAIYANANSSFLEIATAADSFGTTSIYRVGRDGNTHVGSLSTAPSFPYGANSNGGTCDGLSGAIYCGAPPASLVSFAAGVSSLVPFAGSTQSASSFDLFAGGIRALRMNKGASTGTQYLELTPGASGSQYTMHIGGSDTNVPLVMASKGTSSTFVASGSAITMAFRTQNSGTPVNFVYSQNALTTASPRLGADGSDTNIDLTLVAKGSGGVKCISPLYQNGVQVLDTLTAGSGISITGSGNSRTIAATGLTPENVTVDVRAARKLLALDTCYKRCLGAWRDAGRCKRDCN